MERLYYTEVKSPYCEGGIGHGFQMAKSKKAASSVSPKEKLLVVRVATDEDIRLHGNGQTREEIIENLTRANTILQNMF